MAATLSTKKPSADSISAKRKMRGGKTSKKASNADKLLPGSTFRNAVLEEAFLQFCQLMLHDSAMEPFSSWKRRIGLDSIELIGNALFDSSVAEDEVLGDTLLGSGIPATSAARANKPLDLPSHLLRLCETRLLTPEEEWQLFRRMNYLRHRAKTLREEFTESQPSEWDRRRLEGLLCAANWHRDLIVKSNMRLVISIVKKFVNSYNTFDDLLSDGIMALMRAVDKFDYDRGFRFSTYATQVVRRNAYRIVMTKQKERSQVTASIHDPGIDVSGRDENSSLSIERWNDLRSRLGLLLDQLDRREKLIVRARFSLGSHSRVQTLQYLADKLGVSKERVRQLEKRALEKLREKASNVKLPEIEI